MLVASLLGLGGIYFLTHSAIRPGNWRGWLLTLDVLLCLDAEAAVAVYSLGERAYWLLIVALCAEIWAFLRIGTRLVGLQRTSGRGNAMARFWWLYGGNMVLWAAVALLAVRYWLPVRMPQ